MTDAELVLAARCGDKRAFVEIVARHQAMVCGIAYSILTDFAASEDAAQEAFLTAWRKLHNLRDPERLRAWLGQIARNAALGHLRRDKGGTPLEDAPDLADNAPAPDEVVASAEEAVIVRESLARLPETYRLPLVLYYREGKSVRAVAEVLAISEDAVKQRLSRGREMLRDQMSGLVESVLARTGPTAIFTMAVAVAIGALVTPATIAAGVFAGAGTVAGSASAGTASTSILTAMSTSKGLILTAALVTVVSIPIGYRIRSAEPPPANVVSVTGFEPILGQTNATSRLGNSQLFAEWRQLHEKYGTNSEAMPRLYKAINELKDSFRRRAFNVALISEWVQVDPSAGLAFFFTKGHNNGERSQLFNEWLALDPRAAVDALVAAGPGWEQVAHDLLPEIARSAPGRISGIVSQLPQPESFWDSKVRDAFAIVAGDNLDQARNAAQALSGPNRDQALAGVASVWAKSDPQAAIAWAKELPDGVDRAELVRAALIGLAGVNPSAALDQIGIVPPGGKQGYFASSTGARVLQEAVKTDFDGTIGWIAAHPGQLDQEDLVGMAAAVTDRLNADPAGFLNSHAADGSLASMQPAIDSALLNGAMSQQSIVWDWLKTQPDNELVKSLKQQVLNAMAWQNPNQALGLVSDLPTTPEGDAEVQALARSLLNGGQMLYRFDSLFDQAPARLQQSLLQSAFETLRADNLSDPQTWISRLSALSESVRPSGAQSIARAWAERSPEDAINWVQSLPADGTRGGAVAAIASSWAASDPQDATQWVATMSPGPERDQSTRALALAMSETNPQQAWDVAMTIGDTAQRDDTAILVAKMMAARDPSAARQWIDTGPFTPDKKAQLQSAINNGASGVGP